MADDYPYEHVYPYIKVTDCRNTVLVTCCSYLPPSECPVIPIGEGKYIVKATDEVREYRERSQTKGDNLDSVRKSFNRLKALINCNYETPEQVRFVTLTYAENMEDNVRISNDLQVFFRKMHRLYGDFEYIYVKEKQARGAWHLHCVLFFPPGHAPYMANTPEEHPVRDAWGHGFVNVQALQGDINNLGNYLCSYLTDDFSKSKKGGRLVNYESGIRLYNCSKGVKRPEVYSICPDEYIEFISDDENMLLSERDSYIFDSCGKPMLVKHQLFAVN